MTSCLALAKETEWKCLWLPQVSNFTFFWIVPLRLSLSISTQGMTERKQWWWWQRRDNMDLDSTKVSFGVLCLSRVSLCGEISADQSSGLLALCAPVTTAPACFIRLGSLKHHRCIQERKALRWMVQSQSQGFNRTHFFWRLPGRT